MLCYTRFINYTSYPAISVSIDDKIVFTDILQYTPSPYIPLPAGTHTITVFQNNNKVFLEKYLSFPPSYRSTVTIIDDYIKSSPY